MGMRITLILLVVFVGNLLTAQSLAPAKSPAPAGKVKNVPITDEDKTSLENVIVERFYVADSLDYLDTLNGRLDKGAVTYRIYIDLKPNYWLQAVYGSSTHPMIIQTTTRFFNHKLGGVIGYNLNLKYLNAGNILLDSYLTLNSACDRFAGVILEDDKDSTDFLPRRKVFHKRDGFANGNLPLIKPFNLDQGFFNNDTTAKFFSVNNGALAGFSGVKAGAMGPTKDNKILIAQLTTNGKLSFELNIQVGTPSGGVVKYVARKPIEGEIQYDKLSYKQDK